MKSAGRKVNRGTLNEPTQAQISVNELVMIVDDEQDIVDLFRDFLQVKGLRVKTYLDPIEALTEFQVNHASYSLIITDIRMPKMTGIEFVQRVRKIDGDVKVIFMTAFDTENQKIKEGDKAEILRKPVKLEHLFTTIQALLPSESKI